jgi:hypothetical protein
LFLKKTTKKEKKNVGKGNARTFELPRHQLWRRRHHNPRIMINTVQKQKKPKACTPTIIINIVEKRKN